MRRGWQTAVGLILIALALSSSSANEIANEVVRAELCSVAAGRNASDNTLTCYFGLTPEQLRQLTDVAAASGKAAPTNIGEVIANVCSIAAANDVTHNKVSCTVGPSVLVNQVKVISDRLAINQNAVFSLLRVVGEDPNVAEDKVAEALTKAADDYKRLQEQVAALNPDNPKARELGEQAKPEIEAGHFPRAHELLREAKQEEIVAAKQLEKVRDTHMLGAAQFAAADGDVAMTERRYKEAAAGFAEAADYVPAGHASEQGAI
jgi:hypothetical protein